MAAISEESSNCLKQLVLNFEKNETELSNAPKKMIDEFGYACLANSLMFKEPEIPKYNEEQISGYLRTHTFDTLDSLIDYIKSLDNDIDKLFATFAYTALNIQYDTKAYFSGEAKDSNFEEVFNTKKALSSGYSTFFMGIVERINLNTDRTVVKEYHNFAKGYDFDPLNPPKEAKSNHTSIFIQIDGVPFICEPVWAAGQIDDSKSFEPNYDPELFLIPIYKSLCDHYPCGESQKLLPFDFSYDDFLKSCKIHPFKISLKTESNPYFNVECQYGYLEQIYSCKGPVDSISMDIYRLDSDSFTQIETDGIIGYEIIQQRIFKHPEQCRFRTTISFPEIGFYKINLIIDGSNSLTYYVNNLVKCTLPAPLVYNPFHDSKFIPMSPTKTLSVVRHGIGLIRFAVAVQRSDLLWDIIKLTDPTSYHKKGKKINREYGRYIKLNIPFDDERYEDQLCITFPYDGRYLIVIYLSNGINSFGIYTKYYFDVAGALSNKPKPVSPVDFLFNGRTFAPKQIFDGDENEVIIQPNQNCFLIDQREQSIKIKTASPDDKIYLEVQKEGQAIVWPKEDEQKDGEFRQFKWSIPDDFGEYHLIGWFNDKSCMDLTYIFRNEPLRNAPQTEAQLLSDLKQKTDQDESKIPAISAHINEEEIDQRSAVDDKKSSSKCCLLI